MAEKITIGLEKVFFKYILENPEQFDKVDVHFFHNDDIQFIYNVVKEEYFVSKNTPTPQQILAMVKLNDTDKKISDNIVKLLLKGDNSQYEEEWILSRFKAWKLSKATHNNIMKSIDYIRGLDEIDLEQVSEVSAKIIQMFNESKMIADDDDDLGDDFDDPESHKVTEQTKKMATGWKSMDRILGGGWDQASLNFLMGETNVGKSMWMQNIAVNAAEQGANVLFVTLEMGSQKCMRRMGSMRLKIPIEEYDKKAEDSIFMKNKINSLKTSNGGVFKSKPGKIIVKKYDTGTMTVTDLDNFITKYEERKKLKIHMVVVDYINIMGIEKGLDFSNMLFLKGKHLAEGLRYIADKHNIVLISATQTDKSVWGANDLDLKNVPESKAIAETADSFWGIIRNPEMKKNHIYRLKILKLRDGENSGEEIKFDFNQTFLNIENDEFIGTT